MAIQKTITDSKTGVSINYHRVEDIKYDKNITVIRVMSYINAEARNTGKTPASLSVFELTTDVSQLIDKQNPLQYAYDIIKAMPLFEGAIDC